MPPRFRRVVVAAALAATTLVCMSVAVASEHPAAAPTTSAAATSTSAAPTSAAPSTSAGPSTSAAAPTTTGVPTTTEAGPPPRSSRRVATDVDTEKIRPTELPLRTMGIATAVGIAVLAILGFVYGKVRSRVPVPKPAPAVAGPSVDESNSDAATTESPESPIEMPPPTPLPPPQATPLPPPEAVNEWAPPTT